MKITSITIEGMHNVDKKTYQISDLNYLHGPNGAGKSTVLEAIQLAILGYIPGTSKASKEAIFKHSNSHTMAVTLVLDDEGRSVTVRRIWTGTKSTINSSVDIQPAMYDMSKIVADIELPIFNFSEFVGMTANKLKDWFIDFLPSTDVNTDWKTVLAEDVATSSVVDFDASSIIEDAIKEISSYNLSGVDEVRKANEYFKSALSFKKKELERAQSTVQSLIYYDDVDETMTEDEVVAKIQELEDKKFTQEDAFRKAQQNHAVESKLALLSDCSASSYSEDSNYTTYVAEIDDFNKKIQANNEAIDSLVSKNATTRNKITEYHSEIAKIKSELSVKSEIASSEGICPFTKSKCDSIQPMIDEYRSAVVMLKSKLETTEKSIQELEQDIQSVDDKISEYKQTTFTIQSKIRLLESKMQTIKFNYDQKALLESQLIAVPEVSVSGEDLDEQITALKDIQVKYAANKRYNDMIEKLTASKYVIEQEIIIYKSWINLTGVNGLQNSAEASTPFINLASQMNKYIQAVFGESITSKFNLESKANSFSFGIERNGSYIPFNLLSSGEKCLYTLALMLSLVDVSTSPLKIVMVDDLLDHLDDVNINKLFESLKTVKDIQMIFAGVKSAEGEFVTEV